MHVELLIIKGVLMEWPSYYPKSCPPEDSIEINGNIFRLVSGNPPGALDFIPHWNKYVKNGKKYRRLGKHCISCGLSVAKRLDDLEKTRKIIPGFKQYKIAQARLDASHGKIKKTPTDNSKNHHTWWIPSHISKPEQLFRCVG